MASPRRQLAFLTLVYIRVGLVPGRLLMDTEIAPTGSSTWVDDILAEPTNYDAATAEVKAVAREIAAGARGGRARSSARGSRRFRDFARQSLGE